MKTFIIILIVIILIALGGYFFLQGSSETIDILQDQEEIPDTTQTKDDGETDQTQDDKDTSVIGTSVEGNDIIAYNYGTGDTDLLFVGGIHGGYSWNTTLVAYELIDYLEENPNIIPSNVKVTVIPALNPDGLIKTVGIAGRFAQADVSATQEETIPGRFNANGVDLNRNFDCDWQPEGVWQDTTVDAGSAAFSEPETKAIKTYIDTNNPDAVVVWYSAVGGVFASNCHTGVLPETNTLTNLYSDASGYPAYQEFNFYEITGDMVNWLAKEGIPAISVLLTTHEDTEWSKNKAGVDALLEYYSE